MTSDGLDPTVQKAHARVGGTLRGKWTLERLLGVGGMADVYAASHRNGSRGAIKMLHREACVSNQVDHPGAVRVLDDDTAEDGSAFLVLELLLGESLDARLERSGGRLETLEALCLLDQLLAVLAAAHAKGIVHRDIKPDNLFLTQKKIITDTGKILAGTGALALGVGLLVNLQPSKKKAQTVQIYPWTDFSVGISGATVGGTC